MNQTMNGNGGIETGSAGSCNRAAENQEVYACQTGTPSVFDDKTFLDYNKDVYNNKGVPP